MKTAHSAVLGPIPRPKFPIKRSSKEEGTPIVLTRSPVALPAANVPAWNDAPPACGRRSGRRQHLQQRHNVRRAAEANHSSIPKPAHIIEPAFAICPKEFAIGMGAMEAKGKILLSQTQ